MSLASTVRAASLRAARPQTASAVLPASPTSTHTHVTTRSTMTDVHGGHLARHMQYGPLRDKRAVFLVCDIQELFRRHIYEFGATCAVSRKLVDYARILEAPVFVTEQVPSKFGATVPELGVVSTSSLDEARAAASAPAAQDLTTALKTYTVAKTSFSMAVPEFEHLLQHRGLLPPGVFTREDTNKVVAVLFGIETHVCVLQTCLDLLSRGYRVAVAADAVSSIEPAQRAIALRRMERAGAVIGTSESILFELLGDASHPKFRTLQRTLTKPDIKPDVHTLLSSL